MILDFRNNYDAIEKDEIARWAEVGATTILFTVHHPYQFDAGYLDFLNEKIKIIHSYGLNAGIYTGLLGIEKQETIRSYRLERFHQLKINGEIVYYAPHKTKPWGPMFCPNSDYIDFKKHFWIKAIQKLGLDMVYFDLPWFRRGGCYCEHCRTGFNEYLNEIGLTYSGDNLFEYISNDRYTAIYSEFLRFKVKSIHAAIKRTSNELKEIFPHLKTLYNMGSTLSNIDNQYEGSWLCDLNELNSDVMIEYNPYAKMVKTPLHAVTAAVKLAKQSLKGKGDVVFASTISDAPSNSESKFYTPDKLKELYSAIKAGGGIPYVSYATSNINLEHKLSAPVEEYFSMYKEVSTLQVDSRKSKVAVLYSKMSYHYSMRDCVRYSNEAKYYSSQSQYLPYIWNCLGALHRLKCPIYRN